MPLYSSPASACLGGIGMGLVHVLTGPDHLSAVATLACGNSFEAFWLGLRWGTGHSIGLFIVFVVVLSAKVETNNLFMGAMEWWMTMSVGILMICLGLYGLMHPNSSPSSSSSSVAGSEEDAAGKRKQQAPGPAAAAESGEQELQLLRTHHHKNRRGGGGACSGVSGGGGDQGGVESEDKGDDDEEMWKGHSLDEVSQKKKAGVGRGLLGRLAGTTLPMTLPPLPTTASAVRTTKSAHHDHHDHHDRAAVVSCEQACASLGVEGPAVSSLLAVCVGVIHGAAGPGAVLGVLPAVALRDPGMVAGYFVGFVVATIFTMGAFAALFGKLTKELGDAGGAGLERGLMMMSSGACIVVGVAWIGLTLSGVTLD